MGREGKKVKEADGEQKKERQEEREGKEGEKERGNITTIVETEVFIPFTPNSTLKSRLQEADDILSATLRRPRVKFVENAGVSTVTDIGRPNPWAAEVWCSRKDFLVCQGRSIIAAEKEDMALAKVTGAEPSRLKKSEQIALPGCTRDGILYALDCQTCRKEGKRRQYIGENSRSGYQRGKEHGK